ncbi:MAG: hypothetical protein ACOYOK_03870 [Pseudobdellovibrionaceae bacterium]
MNKKYFNLLFLISCFLILPNNAIATSEILPLQLDDKTNYFIDVAQKKSDYSQQVDKVLQQRGFLSLIGQGQTLSVNAIDQMNRVYISKYNNILSDVMILAKSNILVEGAIRFGEIYSARQGYIIHYQQPDQKVTLVFFQNLSLAKIQDINLQLKDVFKTTKVVLPINIFYSWLLPKAWSNSNCGSSEGAILPAVSSSNSDFSAIWNCTKGFSNGVWDSTGGAVQSTVATVKQIAKGTKKLVLHPIETFNSASNELKMMKAMLYDIEESFGELKNSFLALPAEVKTKITCEILGAVGTAGAVAYFTFGSGSPVLFRAIAKALNKVSQSFGKASSLTKKLTALAAKMDKKAYQKSLAIQTVKNPNVVRNINAQELNLSLFGKNNPMDGEWVPPLNIESMLNNPKEVAWLAKDPAFLKELQEWQVKKKQYDYFLGLQQSANLAQKESLALSTSKKSVVTSYYAAGVCTARANAQIQIDMSQIKSLKSGEASKNLKSTN